MKEQQHKNTVYPLSCDQNGFACKTMRWALHEEIMVWVNTFLFQSFVHVTMKDDEISMKEMPLLIIQYIMHKKWWYENQRKIFCGSKRKQEQYFREQSLLISKMQPISLILVVPIYAVLWHICVMNYKTATTLQQTTAFCENCDSHIQYIQLPQVHLIYNEVILYTTLCLS